MAGELVPVTSESSSGDVGQTWSAARVLQGHPPSGALSVDPTRS
jgi:hypothetical protein